MPLTRLLPPYPLRNKPAWRKTAKERAFFRLAAHRKPHRPASIGHRRKCVRWRRSSSDRTNKMDRAQSNVAASGGTAATHTERRRWGMAGQWAATLRCHRCGIPTPLSRRGDQRATTTRAVAVRPFGRGHGRRARAKGGGIGRWPWPQFAAATAGRPLPRLPRPSRTLSAYTVRRRTHVRGGRAARQMLSSGPLRRLPRPCVGMGGARATTGPPSRYSAVPIGEQSSAGGRRMAAAAAPPARIVVP